MLCRLTFQEHFINLGLCIMSCSQHVRVYIVFVIDYYFEFQIGYSLVNKIPKKFLSLSESIP